MINPDVDASWLPPDSISSNNSATIRSKLNSIVLKVVRRVFSQNSKLSINDYIICPVCGTDNLLFDADEVICNKCNKKYKVYDGIPAMYVD